MKKHVSSLVESILFKGLNGMQILELVSNLLYVINKYKKNSTIAIEEDDCNSLGIILSGNVEIHKSFPSGRIVTISHFKKGNIFGEALVFSGEHKYPATIMASTDCEIMYINKPDIIKLMKRNDTVLNNFVSVLSNRILMLNDRLTNLSYNTVRKKISNVILIEYKKQNNKDLILPFCRKKMAEMLNIPRPSLSRELMKMKEDGIIDYHKNRLEIIDLNVLEETLLE